SRGGGVGLGAHLRRAAPLRRHLGARLSRGRRAAGAGARGGNRPPHAAERAGAGVRRGGLPRSALAGARGRLVAGDARGALLVGRRAPAVSSEPGRRDQRKFQRKTAELPVTVHAAGSRVEGGIRLDTTDLSEGGAFLRSDLLFELGEVLELE